MNVPTGVLFAFVSNLQQFLYFSKKSTTIRHVGDAGALGGRHLQNKFVRARFVLDASEYMDEFLREESRHQEDGGGIQEEIIGD